MKIVASFPDADFEGTRDTSPGRALLNQVDRFRVRRDPGAIATGDKAGRISGLPLHGVVAWGRPDGLLHPLHEGPFLGEVAGVLRPKQKPEPATPGTNIMSGPEDGTKVTVVLQIGLARCKIKMI